MHVIATDPVLRWAARRDAVNRANARHSTGPRTAAGKQRSSQNALHHGLTCRTAVLPSENEASYEEHCQKFRDEYQPANATESHLVQELSGIAWRMNRIPLLEAGLLTEVTAPNTDSCPTAAVEALSKLGYHSARLSRQFQKTLDQLRAIQLERRDSERRDLRSAAEVLELFKRRGLPWQPSDHGFVFSKDQIEKHSERLMRQNEARHAAYSQFECPPSLMRSFIK